MSTSNLPSATEVPIKQERLVSLDQFRGYTVVGMLLVNYFGGYKVCPQILRHTHDYCSYADTIMPQFLFAVGFALRLSFGRRKQSQGSPVPYTRMVRRLLGLVFISLVIYQVGPRSATWEGLVQQGFWNAIAEPLKRSWFQTLMHIAVTSLWILPVVRCSSKIRIGWMLGSAMAHVVLSYWFNFEWVNTPPNGIDGGPLGFLTWTIPALVGTLACDVFLKPREQLGFGSATLWKVLLVSWLIMGLGYGFSCGTRIYDVTPTNSDESVAPTSPKTRPIAIDPVWPSSERFQNLGASNGLPRLAEIPFIKPPGASQREWNYWMMSQRGGTLSYLTFSAGFSLFVYLLFFIVCDLWKFQLDIFKTFGTNALVAYILHSMVSGAIQPFFPKDSPLWYSLLGLQIFFTVTWILVRSLEKQGVYLRA